MGRLSNGRGKYSRVLFCRVQEQRKKVPCWKTGICSPERLCRILVHCTAGFAASVGLGTRIAASGRFCCWLNTSSHYYSPGLEYCHRGNEIRRANPRKACAQREPVSVGGVVIKLCCNNAAPYPSPHPRALLSRSDGSERERHAEAIRVSVTAPQLEPVPAWMYLHRPSIWHV
jgi:hypothetical protein